MIERERKYFEAQRTDADHHCFNVNHCFVLILLAAVAAVVVVVVVLSVPGIRGANKR